MVFHSGPREPFGLPFLPPRARRLVAVTAAVRSNAQHSCTTGRVNPLANHVIARGKRLLPDPLHSHRHAAPIVFSAALSENATKFLKKEKGRSLKKLTKLKFTTMERLLMGQFLIHQ